MPPPKIEDVRHERAVHASLTAHRHFAAYLYHLFTHAPLYLHWKRLLSYVRKFRMITFTLRVITIILTILETGALVILTTAVFLVLLPIVAALMLGILVTARIDSRRANQAMRKALEGKRVYLFFLPRGEASFLCAWARELAREGNAVVLISPYWISPAGISGRKFYFTVRKEETDLYLIRRYYFFSFRKQVLKKERVVMVF